MFRIATSAFLFTLIANAALADDFARVDVPFGDLDLSQTRDARILAERLETAAKMVCLKANQPDMASNEIGRQALRECIDAAVTTAMGRVESNLASKLRGNLVRARQIASAQ